MPDKPPPDETLLEESTIQVDAQPEASTSGADISQPESAKSNHAEYVRDLALVLFDRTRPLHDLRNGSRRVLEMAPLLYSLPFPTTKKKPYKAARQLVRANAPQDLAPDEQKVLAALIAYHQRRLKRKALTRLNLSPIQQREVLTVAAILRIAEGLDDSGSQGTVIRQVAPDRQGMWIVVDGPEAESDAAVAQYNARLWVKIGYPEVKVLESTEAAAKMLPFPEPMTDIGIESTDSLAEAGRKVMRYHFAEMLRNEEGTRLGEDIEALHDMRVATRRLRAAFEVFGEAFEPGALKRHLRRLQATGRALGTVRDMDVFMEKAQRYLETLPEGSRDGLEPLLQVWAEQRESARIQMLAYLDSQDYYDFKRKFNIFLRTPGAGMRRVPKDQPTPHQVRELAPVLIYTRLATVRAYEPFLEDASIERLHALRIDFKKLRYTVEYFRETLGEEVKSVVEDLKKLQDHLGDLNDAQVAIQILSEYIDALELQQVDLPVSERQDLGPVRTYMAVRRAELKQLMTTFSNAWEHFNRPQFRSDLALAISTL